MRPALFALALLIPTSAMAEALPPPDYTAEFRGMDVDGDGHVSLSEAAGNGDVVTKFDRADRDRDGKLSRREFDLLKSGKLPKMVARMPSRNAAAGGSAAKKKREKKSGSG
jgi:hypothetical protein